MVKRKREAKEPEREVLAPSAAVPVRSYEDMGDELDDEHPVDALVDRRLDHVALRRRIRATTDRLMEALGEEHDLWLRLEELLGELHSDREAAYFDIGYEHGRAAGRAEGLADGGPRAAHAYRALAQHVREAAVNAGLPDAQATGALIEAAWALLADRGAAGSGTRTRSGKRK
jgi:hypothetical protein